MFRVDLNFADGLSGKIAAQDPLVGVALGQGNDGVLQAGLSLLTRGSRNVTPAPETVLCPAPVRAISMRAPSGKATAASVLTVTVIAAALACSTRWLSAGARL